MNKKIGARMFKKVLNGCGLYLTEDGFFSNGHWAVRDFLLRQRIDKRVDLKVDKVVGNLIDILTIKELITQEPWVLNENITRKVIREVSFYDDIKLIESKEFTGFYELDNIIDEVKDKFLLNKTYYEFISQVLPLSNIVARVIKRISYLVYDGKEAFHDQDYDLIFLWYPKYPKGYYDDLKSVLGVCMPAMKR
jgi:hypothetical protein